MGGGIGGITAALELASCGIKVDDGRGGPVDRRQDDPARQDIPDARLLDMHALAENGRGFAQPQHRPHERVPYHAYDAQRAGFSGRDKEEPALCRRKEMHGLRDVLRGLRHERQDTARIQHAAREAGRHLHALSPGHTPEIPRRPGKVPLCVPGQMQEGVPRCMRDGSDQLR